MARHNVTQSPLELPLHVSPELPLVVECTTAVAPAAAFVDSAACDSRASSALPPLTKAQVQYWRELCGVLTQAGPAGVPSAEDLPSALRPSRPTLDAMVERGILCRRQRAWHLTRPWYQRLTALRAEAVDTPQLRVSERPAPGLPSYAELKAWEALCCWLDTQPRQRAVAVCWPRQFHGRGCGCAASVR